MVADRLLPSNQRHSTTPLQTSRITDCEKIRTFVRCYSLYANTTETSRDRQVVASYGRVVTTIVILLFTITASLAKGPYRGDFTSGTRHQPTIVSGYGSHRHPLASRPSTKLPLKNGVPGDGNANVFIQSSLSLSTRTALNSNSVFAHMTEKNCTVSISMDEESIDHNPHTLRTYRNVFPLSPTLNVTKLSHNDEIQNGDWIPIEGLFGIYVMPSGLLIVWIVKSHPVYTAPPVTTPTTSNTTRTSWWQIQRVSELHLSHVEYPRDNVNTSSSILPRSQRVETQRQLNLLRQALKDHDWYYVKSDGMIIPDMTRTLQSSIAVGSVLAPLKLKKLSIQAMAKLKQPESHFFWNEELIQPLVHADVTSSNESATLCRELLNYFIPVTSAFCGVQTNISIVDNIASPSTSLRYDQILISRRSRFRAGTRFTRRGADSTGAVANYAETEQILVAWKQESKHNPLDLEVKNKTLCGIMSFVQTRGSIPLRWSSPTDVKTYRPRVRIGTDPMAQARAFRYHLVDHAARYTLVPNDRISQQPHPSILMVNLVDKKSDQGRLGRAMDAVLNALLDVHQAEANPSLPWLTHSFVEHLWFDFHAEVKSGRWITLVKLLEHVKPTLLGQSHFFAVPSFVEKTNYTEITKNLFVVKKLQTGVIRTNCMDCLDRTNVVQSIFGRYMLFQQLVDFQAFTVPFPYKTSFRKAPMTIPWRSGEVAHRHLWADNADAISRLYAGTPALKGDFTRTGVRTKMGALDDGVNSLQRYYLNNFFDADRQEGIDLLTGHVMFTIVEGRSRDDRLADRDKIPRVMSIQQAAREILREDLDIVEKSDDETNHVRIKINNLKGHRESLYNKVGLFPRQLDLRWLPGDLQSQVRNLVKFSDQLSDENKETLKGIDNRASSDTPWWVEPDPL
jgi:hypothetical protein